MLFVVAFDEIAKDCKQKFKKYYVGYHNLMPANLQMCAFADGVVLMINTEKKMEDNLRNYNEAAKKFGLNLNRSKTEILKIIVNHEERSSRSNTRIEKYTREAKDKYKYLGTILNNKGTQEDEINNRIQNSCRLSLKK